MQNINNISILKYGLISVVLCFIISLLVFMQFPLDEAVFLKHYYDIEINNNTYMNIHYITSSIDTRRINEIKFPHMPDDFAYVNISYFNNGHEYGYYNIEKFAHYNYNVISLEFNTKKLYQEENKEETVILDKAVVIYNNGDEQEVDIGKIVLHKNSMSTESLTSTFVSSTNDNTSTSEFISNDNLVINSISSYLDEDIKDIFKLRLDGKDINQINYPIKITPDDSLTFDSQFKFDSQDLKRYNVYEIQKRISLIDSEGNQGIMRIHNLDYEPLDIFLREKDIIKYLKETGVR